MTPLQVAIFFHDTYENLAGFHGYITRKDTREFNPDTRNGRLMIAVCDKVISKIKKQDLYFLEELQGNLNEGLDRKDQGLIELAQTMINDWLNELKKIED